MSEQLLALSDADLCGITTALRSGRLAVPCNVVALQRIVSSQAAAQLVPEFQSFADQGFSTAQVALLLETLLKDRSRRILPEDVITLVTTGPEAGTTANRDTGVVVRELFATAERSVLVAGYAVYQGQRVFQALTNRMQERPELSVRMFLDVRRNAGDTSLPQEVVRRFGDRFARYDWPAGCHVPEIYYLPLSLEESPETKAVLHAKCVVVDGHQVFVSSANFTEAAQNRNIEVGLLVRSEPIARRISGHFESMITDGILKPVFRL